MSTQSIQDLRAGKIALVVGLAAGALVLGALGFQYLGGIQPCEMCHWQRWPHIAALLIGLGAGTLAAKDDHQHSLAWLAITLVLVSGLIGAYQTGMQWHLLPGPSSCSGHRFVLGSNMVPDVQCDVVTWQLFGLSLAAYNTIFSFLIAGLSAFFLSRSPK